MMGLICTSHSGNSQFSKHEISEVSDNLPPDAQQAHVLSIHRDEEDIVKNEPLADTEPGAAVQPWR